MRKPQLEYAPTPRDRMNLIRDLILGVSRGYNEDCRNIDNSTLPQEVKKIFIDAAAALCLERINAAAKGKNPYKIKNEILDQMIGYCERNRAPLFVGKSAAA